MAPTESPSLPPEIWSRIVQNLTKESEVTNLWMSRHINKTCKEEVEHIFRQKHLPKTWIDIRYGTSETDPQYYDIFRCSFKFSHLSADGVTAHFYVEDVTGEGEESTAFIYRYCQDYAKEISYAIQHPEHVVQIRHRVNDTPIPEIAVGFDDPADAARMSKSKIPGASGLQGLEKLKLSCNWRDLYSRFYGEDIMAHKASLPAMEAQREWAKEMGARGRRQEVDPMEVIQQLLMTFGDNNKKSNKMARIARIRKQEREFEGQGVPSREIDEREQALIIEKLIKQENAAYVEEFSDDSEEEDVEGDNL